MSLFDIAIVGMLVVFLIALIHANNVLGRRTSYQYVKDNEEMTGVQLPEHLSISEKVRLLSCWGVSSNHPGRIWHVLGVIAIFMLGLWLSR